MEVGFPGFEEAEREGRGPRERTGSCTEPSPLLGTEGNASSAREVPALPGLEDTEWRRRPKVRDWTAARR